MLGVGGLSLPILLFVWVQSRVKRELALCDKVMANDYTSVRTLLRTGESPNIWCRTNNDAKGRHSPLTHRVLALVKATGPSKRTGVPFTYSDIRTRLYPAALAKAFPHRALTVQDLLNSAHEIRRDVDIDKIA